MKLNPRLTGQKLDRLHECDVLDLLHEGEHIPTFAAAKAVPAPNAGAHVEGGSLLIMEGTQALLGVNSPGTQRYVSCHDILDTRASADLINVLAPN